MSAASHNLLNTFTGNEDIFEICEPDEDVGSCFGNYYIDIYDEDIEALKAGKKLVFVDEYGFIIHYKEGEKS